MIERLPSLAVGCAVAFCGSLTGCYALRVFSLRRNLLDHPNERSLHIVPVPRLGGVAIVGSVWCAIIVRYALEGHRPGKTMLAWFLASFLIAGLGLTDDLRPLRASVRLLLQISTASAFCLLVGMPRAVPFTAGIAVSLSSGISLVVWVLFLVSALNIFNFMDGMDGLAGTQAVAAALGIGTVFAIARQPALAALCATIAAASAGFLFHNAPPAKIFMGDSGSTFLGFSFAAFAITGAKLEPFIPLPVFALALAPFLLDGFFTLASRAIRGDSVWTAHRSHIYQRAVGAGASHRDVLVIYAGWMAIASVASVYATEGRAIPIAVLSGGVFLSFFLIWAWVISLERKTAAAKEASGGGGSGQ